MCKDCHLVCIPLSTDSDAQPRDALSSRDPEVGGLVEINLLVSYNPQEIVFHKPLSPFDLLNRDIILGFSEGEKRCLIHSFSTRNCLNHGPHQGIAQEKPYDLFLELCASVCKW